MGIVFERGHRNMEQRLALVREMRTLLGEGKFIYGGYKSQPTIPYGNYAISRSDNYFADDHVYHKNNNYILRVVTAHKDFELESQIEQIFEDLEIGWNLVNDEDIEQEKVHVIQYLIGMVD